MGGNEDPYARVKKSGLKLKVGSRRSRKQHGDDEEVQQDPPPDLDEPKLTQGDVNPASPPLDAEIKKLASMDGLTRAEKAHRLAQLYKRKERLAAELAQTHREKVEQFNKKLNNLSEHFDVPKVGPG